MVIDMIFKFNELICLKVIFIGRTVEIGYIAFIIYRELINYYNGAFVHGKCMKVKYEVKITLQMSY